MSLEGSLNRFSAFLNSNNLHAEAVLELEQIAREAATHTPVVSDEVMGQCAELLESIPIASSGARALVMLLANICLSDSNRACAVRFGIPSTCVLVLQRYKELDDDMLYQVLDLIATLASASGEGRRSFRPAIPHIITCMNSRKTSLEVLFAGSCALSTLALLDASNSEVIVSRGGLQTLVTSFRYALEERTKIQTASTATIRDEAVQEKIHLCEMIGQWCREALLKVIHSPSDVVDEGMQRIDFGRYGHSIEMDQLQWDLKFERKKVVKQLQSSK